MKGTISLPGGSSKVRWYQLKMHFSFRKPSNFITHISFIFLLIKLFWDDDFWTLTLSALPWKFCSSTVYTKNIYLNLTNVLIFELIVNNCKPPEVGTKTAAWRDSPQSRQALCPNLDSAVGYKCYEKARRYLSLCYA